MGLTGNMLHSQTAWWSSLLYADNIKLCKVAPYMPYGNQNTNVDMLFHVCYYGYVTAV